MKILILIIIYLQAVINYVGNYMVNKSIVSLGYPEDFDESLWDKIHEIDEINSVIKNIEG